MSSVIYTSRLITLAETMASGITTERNCAGAPFIVPAVGALKNGAVQQRQGCECNNNQRMIRVAAT
jgi:hypothetical protein